MPNFLIVASRTDGNPTPALTQIVSAEAAGDVITRFEGRGYEVVVHKITAPITGEALAELRKGR
jgi:hypothetical protein